MMHIRRKQGWRYRHSANNYCTGCRYFQHGWWNPQDAAESLPEMMTAKIGKLTVFGTANLATGNDNDRKTNFFGGIDIENGGLVEFPTGRGTATGKWRFIWGVVNVKAGGIFKNNLTTAYWFVNVTMPTTVLVSAGEFNFAGIEILYCRKYSVSQSGVGGGPEDIQGQEHKHCLLITTYENLILSNASLKNAGSNITVNGTLSLRAYCYIWPRSVHANIWTIFNFAVWFIRSDIARSEHR